MPIFDYLKNTPMISRIQRNHGLEHATLHVLAKYYPGKKMAGYSDFRGFWILGDITKQEIIDSVQEALQRLKAGEHKLAIHPNCGTNLATAGSLAGLAGVIGMLGVGSRKRDKLERLPMVALLATLAMIAAQPLGMKLQQKVTTNGKPGNLKVTDFIISTRGKYNAFRVLTSG